MLTIKGKESVRAGYRREKWKWTPGRTYYYDDVVDEQKPIHIARNQMLQALGVKTVAIPARTYAAGYDMALQEMAHRMADDGPESD